MDIALFLKEFNEAFASPFLPEGFASVHETWPLNGKRVIRFQIGDRDAEFEETGHCIASGTNTGVGACWKFQRRAKK